MDLSDKIRNYIDRIIEEKFQDIKVSREDYDRLNKNINKLSEIVSELAEAQKHTEQRLNELAEAQKRTEQRLDKLTETVNSLAEAQKRTEQRLDKLTET
ncbi:MAG: chordopoxvirus fusion protein, partial [Candidatus Helarchaeota archaeon]